MRPSLLAVLPLMVFGSLACTKPRGPVTPEPTQRCEFAVPTDACGAIRRSVAMGLELFRHDKVASVATDALATTVGDLRATNIRGWITARSTDGKGEWVTVFYRFSDDGPELVWRVSMVPSPGVKPTVEAIEPPRTAAQSMQTVIRARQTALAAISGKGAINPVVLPPPDGPGILVYLLAAETKADEVVLGIHHRVLVSDDGERVVELTPLSRSAIAIPLREKGKEAEAIVVTHLLTDYPMEHHVFASLLHGGLPIFVATKTALWEVRGADIRFVKKQ